MSLDGITIRPAKLEERSELLELHRRSLRALSFGFLNRKTVEAFIQNVQTLEEHLITDGNYFVVKHEGRIAACGGWSLRKPAYSDIAPDAALGHEAAVPTVRAMFVDPAFARRGLGRHLLRFVETDMIRANHARAILTATPMGLPLYEKCGWRTTSRAALCLPGETKLDVFNMEKALAADTNTLVIWPLRPSMLNAGHRIAKPR